MNVVAFNHSKNGDSLLNVTVSFVVDFSRLAINYHIAPPNINNVNINRMIHGSIDTCKVQQGILGNFVVKMIQTAIDKYSNYRFKCALKKGFYYAYNFKLDDSMLPLHLIGKQMKFIAEFNVKGKVAKTKSMVDIFTWKIYAVAL